MNLLQETRVVLTLILIFISLAIMASCASTSKADLALAAATTAFSTSSRCTIVGTLAAGLGVGAVEGGAGMTTAVGTSDSSESSWANASRSAWVFGFALPVADAGGRPDCPGSAGATAAHVLDAPQPIC